jgi:ribosomal protein L11
MEDNKKVEAAYVVTIHEDGTFAAHMEQPEKPFEVTRAATAYDILTISQNLVKEIEMGQLTERIVLSILTVMQGAAQPTPAAAVKEKLKERGINPESAVEAE